MKSILICLLLGLSFSYNKIGAINYALKYCNNYNPNYNNYKDKGEEESANFVSQCISVGGGQDLTGCEGLDDKGMIPNSSNLKKCLISKGWKKNRLTIAKGYPIFTKVNSYAMFMTNVGTDGILYCSHAPDRCKARTNYKSVDIYTP